MRHSSPTTDAPPRAWLNLPRVLALIVVTVLSVAIPLIDSGCTRACQESAHCTKTCECTDSQRNQVVECPFMFTCNIETETCEPAHDEWTCDDICATVAARGLCGSKHCESELDCHVDVPCECSDPNTGAVVSTFECEKDIVCNAEINVCASDFALTAVEQCQICAAEQNACGG
jgi:hypothetical protein